MNHGSLFTGFGMFDYAAEDGYDLQRWNTVTISSYGDVYEVDETYGNKCYFNHQCSEPRWASTHKHILYRFKLAHKKIYHIPTNEYYFECLKYKKHSDNYFELKQQCINRIGLKHQKKVRKNSPDPIESLRWLINYCREKEIRNPQTRLQFDNA